MKYIYIIASLFFINMTFVSADACKKNIFIENKCITDNCFNTKNSYLGVGDNFRNLINTEIIKISNFKDWINLELQNNILNKYNGEFIIDNFCEGENGKECIDKNFTLEKLLSYDSKFRIDKPWSRKYYNYNSGREYFFKHYNNILTQISLKDIKINLNDIITNLEYYEYSSEGERYSIKNICTASHCTYTKYKFIYGSNEGKYNILKGVISKQKNTNYYYNISFKGNSVDKLEGKVGNKITLSTKIFTNKPNKNCNEFILKYNISYTYKKNNGQESEKRTILNDKIKVNSNGKLLNHNGGIHDTKIYNNILEISLKEGFQIPVIGKLYFYITIIDNLGKTFTQKINNIAVNAISGGPVEHKSSININYSKDQLYYKDDIFTAKIYLRDNQGNYYSDSIHGINIKHPNQNLVFISNNNNIKSEFNVLGNPFFEFSFSFRKPGNYSKQFKLEIPKLDINGNKVNSNINFSLGNLIDNINIRPKIISEIQNLRCSQKIILKAKCMWDNFSGCKVGDFLDGEKIFDNEDFNGKNFTLIARDNANNEYTFGGIMDHIDTTAPKVQFLNLDFTSLKATDSQEFKINIFDRHPGGCRDISKVKYRVYLNKNNSGYGSALVDKKIENIKIQIIEVEIPELNYIFKKAGNYKIKILVEDAVGNKENFYKEFTIHPGDLDQNKTTISVSSTGDKFANNSDFYTYTLHLKDKFGNSIQNKSVNLIKNTKDNNNHLIEEWLGDTDASGKINFTLKSLFPFDNFEQSFNIKMNKWGDDYIDISESQKITKTISRNNSFKKPILGEFEVIELGTAPEIGKNQKYKIKLNNIGNLSNYSNGKLDISQSTIINSINGHIWNGDFTSIDNNFDNSINNDIGFIGKIDANDNILKSPIIKSNNLKISYKLGSKNISYYLDEFTIGEASCDRETLGLKIIGTLQGDGKADITGQISNISNLSKGKIRSEIRRNAFINIKNRSSGKIINGIKYVEGNITIRGNNLGYETLIVKNGNVIISGDLNTNNKKLGIIVLKDNYNVVTDHSTSGNIYVDKSVKSINAIIYADGAFRSADSNGNIYSDNYLKERLFFEGSLFTRNTIGGAVKGGSSFTLPGGKKTDNFYLAEKFDLNYIRKVPKLCDLSENDGYSFIIKHNPQNQINPPKLFSN